MKKSTWVLIAFVVGIFGGGLLYRHFAQEIDSRGATRLMRALEENDGEKMEKWLNAQEMALQDKSGQTPLFYAARHATQPQVIHKLLLAGADPFVADKRGNTPLMVAAQYNPEPLIVLTLARQGGPGAQQENKNRALRLASRYNTAPVIKMLLKAQASPVADRHEKPLADLLDENERLTEREKNDLRQVMMLLEILQGRNDFERAGAHLVLAETSKPEPVSAKSAEKKPVPLPNAAVPQHQEETLPQVSVSQPKQMADSPAVPS